MRTLLYKGGEVDRSEYVERSKRNIKIARLSAGYDSAEKLAQLLTKRGFKKISQSSISRWESLRGESASLVPPLDYLLALHELTGISLDILGGRLEWGDSEESGKTPTDLQANEIYRMLSNLSPHFKDIAEMQIAVLYNYDKSESIAELRRIIGAD